MKESEKEELLKLKSILQTPKISNIDDNDMIISLNQLIFQLKYFQETKKRLTENVEKFSPENIKIPNSIKKMLTTNDKELNKHLEIIDNGNIIGCEITLTGDTEHSTVHLKMKFIKSELGFYLKDASILEEFHEQERQNEVETLYKPSYRKHVPEPIIEFYKENKALVESLVCDYEEKKLLPTGLTLQDVEIPLYFNLSNTNDKPDYTAYLDFNSQDIILYRGTVPSILNQYYFDQTDWEMFSIQISNYLLIQKEKLPEDLKKINNWYEKYLATIKLDLNPIIQEAKQDSTDKNTKPKIKLLGIKNPTD